MNREDIIRMAREAGIDAETDTLCRHDGWVEPLKRFAALVVANNPPQSSMAWQEGYAAGAAAAKAEENEACAKVCKELADAYQKKNPTSSSEPLNPLTELESENDR